MCNNTNKPTLDWGKPLQTIHGHDAVLLTKEYKNVEGLQYVVMVTNEVSSFLYVYFLDGRPKYQWYPMLLNKTRKVTKWYNLYRLVPGAEYYNSESEARSHISIPHHHLATLSIEIEEPL